MSESQSRILPVLPEAVAQKMTHLLKKPGAGAGPVVLIRSAPRWAGDPTLQLPEGRVCRVVPCASPLAIWDELAAHRGDQPLAILTDLDVQELGYGLRSRVLGQRIETISPWELVHQAFGVKAHDGLLGDSAWIADALIAARPAQGWPMIGGALLSRDAAFRHLAAARLGVDRLGRDADDLDVATLLSWTGLPAAPESFWALPEQERTELVTWMTHQWGRPVGTMFALGRAHIADAVPFGLVAGAVWAADDQDSMRARGRMETWFDSGVDDTAVRSLATAAHDFAAGLLSAGTPPAEAHTILDRAEQLLGYFSAGHTAAKSDVLRSGLEQRMIAVAQAVTGHLDKPDPSVAAAALDRLCRHALAPHQDRRIRRMRMLLRLTSWLSIDVREVRSVADGIDRQIAEWGWVDWAAAEVWAGDDLGGAVTDVFAEVYRRVALRRKELDRAFASRLAVWTKAGPGGPSAGEPLLVEQVLARVVQPLVRSGFEQQPLLLVLDGMSSAVAVELAQHLHQHWNEFDPIASGGPARRRGVVAALPTVTAVSRSSLFAGRIREGNAAAEEVDLAAHDWGKQHRAELFHKADVPGDAGATLATDIAEAIADPKRFVAVVINTVDDALASGREGDSAGWDLHRIGLLSTLLDRARSAGRPVLITSDHGHVLERGGELRTVSEEAKARFRTGTAPVVDGEVELAGPRVLADGGRIVALWDTDVRYRQRRAGYHGGASLAEVTIPLLAFLPIGAARPPQWAALDTRAPQWWTETAVVPTQTAPVAVTSGKGRRASSPTMRSRTSDEGLFDLPASVPQPPAPAPAAPPPDLIDELMKCATFKAQHQLTPRPVDKPLIRRVLMALIDANGVLPLAVVAERAELPLARAGGFVTTLQRIFNVDGYEVLALVDAGRTVRLDQGLLRTQFDLGSVANR